jgi:hypothetical protein
MATEQLEKLIKQWHVLIKNPNLDKTSDLVLFMIKQVNTLSINKNEPLAKKIKTMYEYNQYARNSIRLKLSLEAADNYEQGKGEGKISIKVHRLI